MDAKTRDAESEASDQPAEESAGEGGGRARRTGATIAGLAAIISANQTRLPNTRTDLAASALHTGVLAADLAAGATGGPKVTAGRLVSDLLRSQLDLTQLTGALSGGLSTKLIEGWREQLAIGQKEVQLNVAGSMSRIIADAQLGAVAAATIRPNLPGEALKRAINEATTSYLTGIGQALRESVSQSVWPAALAATSALMERIKASSEAERLCEEALWRMAWWVPPSASTDFFWEVGRLALEGRRVELRRAMTDAARSRDFGRIVESWMELEVFRRRRRFIRDGLQDHRRGRYRVSIPTLLPHLEGIAIDAFAPGSTDTNPKGVITMAVATYEAVMGPAMVDAVTVLWARQDFDLVPAGSRRLNRQLILHGRSTGYATEENSAKVLFALDLLSSLVQDAERHEKRSKAS